MQIQPKLEKCFHQAFKIAQIIATDNWLKVVDPQTQELDTIRQNLKVLAAYQQLRILKARVPLHETGMKKLNDALKETIKERIWVEEQQFIEVFKPNFLTIDKKAVLNTTNKIIPDDVFTCLSFGPKFLFPSSQDAISFLTLIAETENIVEENVEMGSQMARVRLKNICMPKLKNTQNTFWLNFILARTKRYFIENNDVIAIKSDKGKMFVVMYEEEYRKKLNDLILTPNYIEIHDENMLIKLIRRNNAFISVLERLGLAEKWKNINDNNCEYADMYGLPKPHKANMPLRPIVASMKAPGFNLSKIVLEILKNIFEPKEINLKNSLDLKSRISKTIIIGNKVLVSFDVISMFTSIPVKLVLDILKLHEDKFSKLMKDEPDWLSIIIKFILEDCAVFRANGKVYKQKGGIGMGGVLSPLIARLVMEHIFEVTIKKLKIKPEFIYIFVDDSVALIEEEGIEDMLKALNEFDSRIQFTVEKETNNRINFLDMTLIRENNRIKTNWYCKEYASHRLVNFLSSHEEHTIYGTAQTFIETVRKLSDPCFFQENKRKIETTLRFNNFSDASIIGMMGNFYTLMSDKGKMDAGVEPNEFKLIDYPPITLITAKGNEAKTPSQTSSQMSSQKTNKTVEFTSIPLLNGMSEDITKELRQWCTKHACGRPVRKYSFKGSIVKDKKDRNKKTDCILKALCDCGKKVDFLDMKSDNLGECKRKYETQEKCINSEHKISKVTPFCTVARKGNKGLINLLKKTNEENLIIKLDKSKNILPIWQRLIQSKKEEGYLNVILHRNRKEKSQSTVSTK